jgi:zinc protease
MKTMLKRGLALSILVQLTIVTCALAQPTKVREVRLGNGLTVLMKESHAAPVFTAQIWFKVGSRNEHTGITGISHLLEHMLFNSSKNYKKGEISKMVHERGGIDNAATWTDFTYYWDLLSSDNLEFAIKTLAEKAGNALLLDSEFQKERVVVRSELEGDENDPDTLLYEAVMAAAFVASGYHWPTIGFLSDVENIDRTQLADYYHAYYHPNNATLVLVGDFNSDKALALAKKYFGPLGNAKLPRPPYTTEPTQHGERRIIIHREGTAERVTLGYHVPSLRDPDAYPLIVLDQILSGGRSSRLYQSLVEKQLATSAWSSAGNRTAPSLFMLGATARQGVVAGKIETALLAEVETAKNELPSDNEMQSAKNQLEAYFVYQNDSVSDQGEQLGYYNTVADWHYLEQLIAKVKLVTAEQVREVARKYFTPDNLTVGTFIPTGPAQGGMSRPPSGAVRNSVLPGLCYYRKPGAGQAVETAATKARSRPAPTGKAIPHSALRTPQLVKPYRVTLDNGMVVIVQENHSNPTIAISGNLKAGRNFDPEGKNGVASLTSEMLGRGTAKRTSLELAHELEFTGAQLDTSADVEYAGFTAKSLKKDFELVLDLLSDELRNASFPQDQFERARGEMLSQLAESKESPEAQASRAFHNAVFPAGHPYHRLTVEQAQESLQGISRDDLVAFHAKHYRPDTAIIVIAGDVDAKQAVELIKKYFGDWKAEGPTPKVEIPTIQPPDQGEQVVIPMMDKTEVDVVFGYPLGMKRSDPDYYAFRIANQILGGSGALTSIFGEDIREKNGLVYDVSSTFDAGLGAGPWYATLGSNPKNADKAIDLLKKDIAKFAKSGATPEQFKRTREFIIGVFPIALETNSGVARVLLSSEFYGLGTDYVQKYASIYRAITLDQVNAAAKKYLRPDSATLVIAGPYAEKK